MKAMQILLYGKSNGDVRLECDRHGCTWLVELPPYSTALDLERAMRRHTHPGRTRE